MKALFGFQDVMDIVRDGFPEIGATATEAQRSTYKENKKKDCKAVWFIHQSVDEVNFHKISKASSSKQAWDILEKCYAGGDKIKKVKLQVLQRQYELLQMEESKKIEDLFKRV